MKCWTSGTTHGRIQREIDEIEQEGTWHNEGGHATSFAAKRYKLDLDMLKKDQDMYQNDSHGLLPGRHS